MKEKEMRERERDVRVLFAAQRLHDDSRHKRIQIRTLLTHTYEVFSI
jgi:hypothetical protein